MTLFNKISDKEKREFFPIAEHKLKTPVSAMKWNIELLQNDPSLSKELKDIVSDISKINQKTIQTITDFFIVLKIRESVLPSKVENVEVSNLINQVLDSLSKVITEQKITVEKNLSEVSISIDPELFTMMLTNIIDNAVKYSKDKGNINISISADENVKIQIEDKGIGIPEEEKDRIFELFYRASNAAKLGIQGSGLGLAISNSLVQGWGGSINFESKENEGSKFSIILPKETKSDFILHTINNGSSK